MSRITTKRAVSKGPIISSDASTTEHGDLLLLVWSNIEPLIRTATRPVQNAVDEMFHKAWSAYLKDISVLATHLTKGAKEGNVSSADSDRIIAELRAIEAAPPAIPRAELFCPEIEEMELEAPIFDSQLDRYGRRQEKQVGFIDIDLTISRISTLTIETGFPSWVEEEIEGVDYGWTMLSEVEANSESKPDSRWAGFTPPPPTVTPFSDSHRIWVDVRKSDMPVGQLIREIKLMRSYEPEASFFVVLEDASSQTKEMLMHESIMPFTRKTIEYLVNAG